MARSDDRSGGSWNRDPAATLSARDHYFRPRRHRSGDFAPLDVTVHIQIGGQTWPAAPQDISQSGLAVLWPQAAPLPHEELDVETVTIAVDGFVVLATPARVVSVRADRMVALELRNVLLRMDGLWQAQDVMRWRMERPAGAHIAQGGWHGDGSDAFKARVAEFSLLLREARKHFSEMEQGLPWQLIHAPAGTVQYDALMRYVAREFTPAVLRHAEAIDAARRLADPTRDDDLRDFSRALLHEDMIQAPWMRRALEKPLGYPGDFVLMRYVYELPFEGSDLFAKAMAYSFLQTPAACAVRERKNLIKRQIRRRLADESDADRPLRVLSIAAGPAQEIYELLSESETLPRPLEIVLFDMDRDALAYAYGRLKTLAADRDRVRLTYLREDAKALLDGADIFSPLGKFDGIICCGLYDYLSRRTATALTGYLYRNLSEGGEAWIGNMVPENSCRWFMEHHQEWTLRYRDRDQLRALGTDGAPDAEVDLIEEATGINPFLRVRRK